MIVVMTKILLPTSTSSLSSSYILRQLNFVFLKHNKNITMSSTMSLSSSSGLEHLVFVYGTLKKDQPNHKVMLDKNNGNARFVSKAKTLNRWPLVIASHYNIPYLIDKQNFGHFIHGEIYMVDDCMLKFLDDFEGHPTYYLRQQTEVLLLNDDDDNNNVDQKEEKILRPWIYFLKKYKPEMLKLPMIDNYDSYGKHGLRYVERCDRKDSSMAKFGHTEKDEVLSEIN